MKLKILVILVVNTSLLSLGFGATQGALGPTSTGSVDISLTIPQLVSIRGLSDIDLGTISGAPAMGSTNACIYSNNSGNYAVTVTGSGAGGAFTLAGTVPNIIPYTATWTSTAGTTNLTAGTKLTGQTGANTSDITCSNSTNATFTVNFSQTAITGAASGAYTGTATIIISPT